jgi:uncharacterized damage-inducible protein DinB
MNDVEYLQDARRQFDMYKKLADNAISRVDEDQFYRQTSEGTNSIAILVKHMAGNMHSRWTDFLKTDGEKPDRHRDAEFELTESDSRTEVMRRWESGWQLVFDALVLAETVGLERALKIRSQPYTLLQAINRQLTHYAYHVGQILLLAIQFKGADWESLSVPRGNSEQFNLAVHNKHQSKE